MEGIKEMQPENQTFQTNYKRITVKTIDGSTLYGKVNIAGNSRVSDLFINCKSPFVVLVDASYKDAYGKVFFINKNHIVWVEPDSE